MRMTQKKSLVNTIVFILILTTLLSNMTSCRFSSNVPPQYFYEDSVVYSDLAVSAQTRNNGKVLIQSSDESVSYEIKVIDKEGTPVDGFIVNYKESYGESIFIGYDPDSRYSSVQLRGTADDLQHDTVTGQSIQVIERFLITGTIVLIVFTVVSISYTAYEMFKVAEEVKEYYHATSNGTYYGNIILQTTIDDFVENHLIPQMDFTLGAADIAFSIVTFGTGTVQAQAVRKVSQITLKELAYEALKETLKQEIKVFLKALAVNNLEAVTESSIASTPLYIVLDAYKRDSTVGKLFANFSIYLEDPRTRSISGLWNAYCNTQTSSNTDIFSLDHTFNARFYLAPGLNDDTAIYFYDFFIPTEPNVRYKHKNIGIKYNNTFSTTLEATINGYSEIERSITTNVEGEIFSDGKSGTGSYDETLYITGTPVTTSGNISFSRVLISIDVF